MKKQNVYQAFFRSMLLVFIVNPFYTLANESAAMETENQGTVAFTEGRYQEAKDYFTKLLLDPVQKNESLIYLSRIALDTGGIETAVEHIEAALVLEPTYADEIVLAGDIYCNQAQQSSMFAALGLAKKCIAQYEAAIKHSPEDASALLSAIRFYLEAPGVAGGSTKKGKALLERLAKVSPEHANTYQVFWLDNNGDPEAAMKLADEMREKSFQSAQNQYELARFYRDKKMYTKAQPLFKSLASQPATPRNKWYVNDSLLQLGEILLAEKQDIKHSIELLEQYKQKNTNPYDQHYFWSTWSLAQAYKMNGDKDKYMLLIKQIQTEGYEKNPEFANRFEAGIKEN
jgi:tetratricopeptide (TPR) repeat protein